MPIADGVFVGATSLEGDSLARFSKSCLALRVLQRAIILLRRVKEPSQ